MSPALRQPSFAVLLLMGWLVVSLQLLALYWTGTAETLLDTDDAMRLVQVRDFLAGQGWFDLREMRVEPPVGYESHWSRLIDAGLAGLFRLFQLFSPDAVAERLMRTLWPLLWLLPAMLGVAAIAWRLAGREAVLVALLLAVVGLPALQLFKPGSIDHHNVQIALAVLTLAAAVWSDRLKWAAWAAGALTGLALAIGLESLPLLATCGVALAIRFMLAPPHADRNAAAALSAYGLSLAAATLAAFLISVGADHWGRSLCDAIAINLAAPVIIGGLLLAGAAGLLAEKGVLARGAAVAGVGGLMLGLFVAIEPRCLAGPYALMDPSVRPIWLEHVAEMQPLLTFGRLIPVKAAALMAFPAAALVSVLVLARDAELRRDFGFLLAGAVFAVAFLTTVAAIKAHVYAMWLGMPLVALMALRLCAFLNLSTLNARLVATVLLTPTVLSAGAIGLAQAARLQATAESQMVEQSACFKTDSYRTLAQLPAGLIAADVDFGPFLLALTPHSVLAAPYHRLSKGVVAAHQAFAAPPDEARQLLERMRVTYLITCGGRAPLTLTAAEQDASLWKRLQVGALPDWLEPVPETSGQPLLAFRIRR
jgi:hypothetical protein